MADLPEESWDDWCSDFNEGDVLDYSRHLPSGSRINSMCEPEAPPPPGGITAAGGEVMEPLPDLMAMSSAGGLRVGQLVRCNGMDCEVTSIEGDSITCVHYTFP